LRFIVTRVNLFDEPTAFLAVVKLLARILVRRPYSEFAVQRLGVTLALAAGALAGAGRGRPVRAASPATAPAAARPRATGRIEGMVEISASLAPRRPRFRIYSDPGIGSLPPAAARDPVAAELRNVVLYLEGDSARLSAPGAPAEGRARASIAQRDERFVPHVLAVLQGSTVEFPNEDDVYHNVFSLSSGAGPNGRGFDLGRYPKGASRSVTFVKPGLVQVFCHIHADMSAYVHVMTNPYFTSPGDDHRFVIDDVPEGDYTIVGWHERIKPIAHRVHVTAGQTTSIDFNIPLPQGGAR
jgi:plastocyanin